MPAVGLTLRVDRLQKGGRSIPTAGNDDRHQEANQSSALIDLHTDHNWPDWWPSTTTTDQPIVGHSTGIRQTKHAVHDQHYAQINSKPFAR